jgi:hypothetical protein
VRTCSNYTGINLLSVACKLFRLIWPDKSSPPLQRMEAGRWPLEGTWCVNWLVDSRLASIQAGREVCP